MLRWNFHCRLILFLCAIAVVSCAYAATTPAILHTDAFIATPYDANTALVFFSSSGLVPATAGVPAAALPQAVTPMVGSHAQLRLENADGETTWRKYWPGGEAFAPKLGQQYVVATGEHLEHGMMGSVGYLKVCDEIWLVGLVTVEEADRDKYAGSNLPVGMVAYAEPEGGVPEVKAIVDRDEFTKLPSQNVMKDDKSLTVFPMDALPMLEQGDDHSGDDRILLTQEQTMDSVVYSLKRITPGGLVPAGVFFENRCRVNSVVQ